jgi:hypothetical protein
MFGFVEGWKTSEEWSRLNPTVCFPDKTTWQQVAEAYLKWASEHPELLHFGHSQTMLLAFEQAFPCQNF